MSTIERIMRLEDMQAELCEKYQSAVAGDSETADLAADYGYGVDVLGELIDSLKNTKQYRDERMREIVRGRMPEA